jgi:hypothetical protein
MRVINTNNKILPDHYLKLAVHLGDTGDTTTKASFYFPVNASLPNIVVFKNFLNKMGPGIIGDIITKNEFKFCGVKVKKFLKVDEYWLEEHYRLYNLSVYAELTLFINRKEIAKL